MSVFRVSSYICLNSAACSLQKTGIKNLRAIVPHVSSGIRNIWSIPRFQPIASIVFELQGIWRGCANQSSGDDDDVIPAKWSPIAHADDFDLQPVISLRKELGNDIIVKISLPTAEDNAENWGYELVSFLDVVKEGMMEELKRQTDLEEQLMGSEEEVIVLRKRLSKLEEENKNLNREVDSYEDTILRMRNSPLFKDTYERD